MSSGSEVSSLVAAYGAARGGAGVRRTFHVAGVVDPRKHYVIDRSAWHGELAEKIAGGAFALLHSHRQGGKSSAARCVGALLEAGNRFRVLACTLENARPANAAEMWTALAEKLRGALLAFPPGLTPPRVVARAAEGPLFVDEASFQAFFRLDLWGGARVVLIIDEFDTLLAAPVAARQALLASLRSLRTERDIAPPSYGAATALHAVLGIGVHQLLQLAAGEEPRRVHSPFNVADVLTVPPTTVTQVERMLGEFAADVGRTLPETVVHDVFWRSGGHVGLLSLLGQQLERLCGELAPGGGFDDASWLAVASGTTLLGEMRASATVASMLRSVSRTMDASAAQLAARQLVRDMLSAPEDSWLEVADDDPSRRDALSYLLTEGVIVEERRADTPVHRIVAPMVVPLLMRDVGSHAVVARLPPLPFARRPDGIVDLQKTVLELLPFLNLDAVYHPYALLKGGQPCEYAYHFQLFDLMAHRAGDGGWRVLGGTRNAAAHGPLRRLDLLIASNGCRCGVELLVDGKELDSHVYEQAAKYRSQQRLTSVLVVNFASSRSGIVHSVPTPLPVGVELLQVLVDRSAATLTPYTLDCDGRTAVELASMLPDTTDAGAEGLVAPLAGLAVAASPTRAVLAGLTVTLETVGTVAGLLAATADEFDEPLASVSLWLVHTGGEERVMKVQAATQLAVLTRAPGARLELRRGEGKPPLPLTLR